MSLYLASKATDQDYLSATPSRHRLKYLSSLCLCLIGVSVYMISIQEGPTSTQPQGVVLSSGTGSLQVLGQENVITLYQHYRFEGKSISFTVIEGAAPQWIDLRNYDLKDKVSSLQMGAKVKALFCWNDGNAYTNDCVGDWDDAADIVGPYKTLDVGSQNDEWNSMRIEYYNATKTPVVQAFGAVGYGLGHAGILPLGNYELQTQLRAKHFDTNDIGSIVVPNGLVVRLYEGSGNTGVSQQFQGYQKLDFGTTEFKSWNDKIRSITVESVALVANATGYWERVLGTNGQLGYQITISLTTEEAFRSSFTWGFSETVNMKFGGDDAGVQGGVSITANQEWTKEASSMKSQGKSETMTVTCPPGPYTTVFQWVVEGYTSDSTKVLTFKSRNVYCHNKFDVPLCTPREAAETPSKC